MFESFSLSKKSFTIIVFFLLLNFPLAQGQSIQAPDSAGTKSLELIPNKDYQAGSAFRFFFGDNWRDIWTAKIKIPVLDLDNYAGGLKPIKLGGGFQTRSLRFLGKDGRQYKFRALNKITEKLLPKELINSVVDDVLKDSYSSSNPLSAIIASPIINSVGALQSQPILVVLPDHERLGKYREEFAGLIGTLELHPDDFDDESENFAGANKIFGTYKLFKRLDDNSKYKVDAPEFLKARLLDIYMGDWDRHYDQWRWAAFKKNGKMMCRPIPRDRDQAFCHYDGFLAYFVTVYVMQIETFDDDYPPMKYLTWSGRYLDRKFLSEMNKATWDSIANFVVSRISDSVIDRAVGLIPREVDKEVIEDLREDLIERRNHLKEASDEYYELLARWVDVRCTNNNDLVEINIIDNDRTELKIYSIPKNEENSDIKDHLFFHRVFNYDETDEIRLYLFDGNDKVLINGEVDRSIDIQIVAGEGRDSLIDKSEVDGYLFGILPIFDMHEIKNYFYDSGKKTYIEDGPSTHIIKKQYDEPKNDTLRYEPPVRDWGKEWWFLPWFSLSSDYGLFIGGGASLYKYLFKAAPYQHNIRIRAGYSALFDDGRIEFNYRQPNVVPDLDFWLKANYSGIDVLNYFGFGNEGKLPLDPGIEHNYRTYYRLYHSFFAFRPSFRWHLSEQFLLESGLDFEFDDHDPKANTYIADNPVYGTDNTSLLSIFTNVIYDSRSSELNPKEGVYLEGFYSYTPKFWKNDFDFTRAKADARAYYTTDILTDITWAARFRIEKIWGKAPFYRYPIIGGFETLRGFHNQRFVGQSSIIANFESRIYLFPYNLLVPGKLGLIGLSDIGRVYDEGEDSEIWHNSYGGGLWLTFINDDILASIYAANSKEMLGFYFQLGFMF